MINLLNKDCIFSTKTYLVRVGVGAYKSTEGTTLYQVFNKLTEVVEVELSTLYRAVMYAKDLEASLEEAEKYVPHTGGELTAFDLSDINVDNFTAN